MSSPFWEEITTWLRKPNTPSQGALVSDDDGFLTLHAGKGAVPVDGNLDLLKRREVSLRTGMMGAQPIQQRPASYLS